MGDSADAVTRGVRVVAAAVVLVALLTGCASVTIPTDPDDTLTQVTGGTLRVGVSVNPPWTDFPDGTGSDPTGSEVTLVEEFARTLDAEVEWTAGSEEGLVGQLERGELDLVIGGLTAQAPWSEKAALTYRYTVVTGPDGSQELHVMAVPMGENAFLVALERFLLVQDLPR
jgi:ABC-type amino acid transport substrate-binding protein